MHTFLICGKNISRAEHAQRQLKQLEMPYCVQDAVYLTQKAQEESSLTLGEQGCALAHLAIYEQMLCENTQEAIVLEDDCVVSEPLWSLIPDNLSEHFDIVLLGRSKLSPEEFKLSSWIFPIHTELKSNKHSIGQPWKLQKKGTVGYWISLSGAKKISQLNKSLDHVADDWPAFSNSVSIGEIRPLVVFEDTAQFGSEIEMERTGNQNMIKIMTKRKILGRLLKGIYQILILKLTKKSRKYIKN